MCFGLTTAPWVFTKLMKPVLAYLRSVGITCVIYLDDILIIANSATVATKQLLFTKATLRSLGFIISPKSSDYPSQIQQYLGFIINTVDMTISLPPDKLQTIKDKFAMALTRKTLPVRTWQQLLGYCTSTIPAIKYARFYSRGLQSCLIPAQITRKGPTVPVPITSYARLDLHYWANLTVLNTTKSIIPDQAVQMLFTDSSDYGYGAVCQGEPFWGYWLPSDFCYNINVKELLAIQLAFSHFLAMFRNQTVLILTDNMACMFYLLKQGGTKCAHMTLITLEIYALAIEHNVTIMAKHIPGKKNITADLLSRMENEYLEWKLDYQALLPFLQQHCPTVDMFASHRNARLPRYVSWRPEVQALWTDAFSQSWIGELPYIFPPPGLLLRILRKIYVEQLPKAMIIAPFWPNQTYFPRLMEMTLIPPQTIPYSPQLVTCPISGRPHPLGKTLKLTCFLIGGQESICAQTWDSPQI